MSEETTGAGGLTFEAAKSQLKALLGIEVVEAPEAGRYALMDTGPYRLRPGQVSVSEACVVRLGRVALLRNQVAMYLADVEAADARLGEAYERTGSIADYYAGDLKEFALKEAGNLRTECAGCSRPVGQLVLQARGIMERLDRELEYGGDD